MRGVVTAMAAGGKGLVNREFTRVFYRDCNTGRPRHATGAGRGDQATAIPAIGVNVSAPSRAPRLMALTSARNVAVTMFASRPTP